MTHETHKGTLLEVRGDCPNCMGDGYDYGMDCCGDFFETGECKSHCAVQTQEQCRYCNGDGFAIYQATQEKK